MLATGLAACSSEGPPPVYGEDAALAVDIFAPDVPVVGDRGTAVDGQLPTDMVAVTDNDVSADRGAVIDSGISGEDATANTDNGITGSDVVIGADNGITGSDVVIGADNGITGSDVVIGTDNGIGTTMDAGAYPDNGIHGSDVVIGTDNGIGTTMDAGSYPDNGIHGPDVVIGTDNGIGTTMDAGAYPDNGIHGSDAFGPMDVGAGPGPDAGIGNQFVGGTVFSEAVGVSNATVTVVDHAGAMVVTGADGRFSFPLPIGSNQLIRMTRTNARTQQEMVLVPSIGVTSLQFDIISNDNVGGLFTALSLSEDSAQGILVLGFNVDGTHPGGYGASLSVTGGVRVVATGSGVIRRDTTVPNESILLILNVPTGPVTITATPPSGRTCSPVFGTATTRIDARTITRVNFNCR